MKRWLTGFDGVVTSQALASLPCRLWAYDEKRHVTKPTSPLDKAAVHVPDFDILVPARELSLVDENIIPLEI